MKIKLGIFALLGGLGVLAVQTFLMFLSFSPAFATATPTPIAVDAARADRARELWERGDAYSKAGMTQRANEYWDAAKKLDPGVGEAPSASALSSPAERKKAFEGNLKLALKDSDEGDYEMAMRCLAAAEKADPDEPRIQPTREKIILADFKIGPEKGFENIIKVNFDSAVASYRRQDYKQALDAVNQALDINHTNSRMLAFRELIRAKMGIVDEETASPTATPDNEDGPKVAHPKHAKRKKKETPPEAQAPSKHQLEAESDLAYNTGLESYNKGDLKTTRNFWREAVRINPQNSQARNQLDRLFAEHPDLKDTNDGQK